jgi:TM2 domain-containing membrane protein YozV
MPGGSGPSWGSSASVAPPQVGGSLVAQKADLSERELALVESEMRSRSKSMLIAYVIWLFVGVLGGHRFYLGQRNAGIAYLVTFIIGLLLAFVLIGFLVLFILGLLVLIDGLRIPGWLTRINSTTEQQVIGEVRATRH